MAYFLVLGDDTLDQAKRHASRENAVEAFREFADDMARSGQESYRVYGYVHIASNRDLMTDYPDLRLSLGRRGGVVIERM